MKNRWTRKFLERVEEAKKETTEPAKEVLEHLYQALLALPDFTLKDGTKAELEPYIAPELNREGAMECGVDVVMGDGSHLEFTVANTGWGRGMVETTSPRKLIPRKGRRR